MLTLHDLFDHESFLSDIAEGFIRVQTHPTLPLSIANYTEKATFARHWTAATLRSRGLIFEQETLRVVASGCKKFFNYGEPSAPELSMSDWVRMTTKHDGSLGIGYRYVDADGEHHFGIATRGSFASEQALHATANLTRDDRASIEYADLTNQTRIFEIVYPENRIVLNYGDRDELIKLGTVSNQTGLITHRPREVYQSGPITLREALSRPIPDDEEGYVLDIESDFGYTTGHVKLKGDRYKELHAAIFGLNERAVWEAYKAGIDTEFIEQLPDETHVWATRVLARLEAEYMDKYGSIRAALKLLPEFETRKETAIWIMSNYKHISSPLFLAIDGKCDRVDDWIFEKIRPEHVPFATISEAVS